MRSLLNITADLKKVNHRIGNLVDQIDKSSVSQQRLINQRLETLTTIKEALELEQKIVHEEGNKLAQSLGLPTYSLSSLRD